MIYHQNLNVVYIQNNVTMYRMDCFKYLKEKNFESVLTIIANVM